MQSSFFGIYDKKAPKNDGGINAVKRLMLIWVTLTAW